MLSKKQTWWNGKNENLEWLQFGDLELKVPLISMTRTLPEGGVTILIHTISENSSMPGPASFSMETGTGDQTIAVDGYGMLVKMNDGAIGFQTAELDGENKNVFANVVNSAANEFRVVVNGKEFIFPIYEFNTELKNIFR